MNREYAEKPMTDEAFSELLASKSVGDGVGELARLQASLQAYRDETLVWAERRSAAMPSLAAKAKRRAMWAAVPHWSLAAVAALTVGVGLVHFSGDRTRDGGQDRPAVAAVQEEAGSSAQIAADNSLLTNIDSALQYDAESSAAAIGLNAGGGATAPAVPVGETN